MHQLCRITAPGLSLKWDCTAVRERVLADFPNVHEVVATTAPGTLLVVHSGPDQADAWLDAVRDLLASRRVRATRRLLSWRDESPGGDGSAA